MSDITKIQWTDHTFNPWIGCAKVSDGCINCYAEVDTFARRERARGLELWGPWAARHVTSDEKFWKKPLAWDRSAREAGVRRRVFCASMADVFEDRDRSRSPSRAPLRAHPRHAAPDVADPHEATGECRAALVRGCARRTRRRRSPS